MTTEKLETARRVGKGQGIDAEQLYLKDNTVWYRSHDYGEMVELNLPSADSITLRELERAGKGWGQEAKLGVLERQRVPQVVNVTQIIEDCKEYPDQRFIQYLQVGGPANIDIPFRRVVVTENYKMSPDGEGKVAKAVNRGLERGTIISSDRYAMVREHKTGAIPKSRKDRTLREQGLPCAWRAISDMKAEGVDGLSVNMMTDTHGSLDLAQGVRLHNCIISTRDSARKRGLEEDGLVAIKIDIVQQDRRKLRYARSWPSKISPNKQNVLWNGNSSKSRK